MSDLISRSALMQFPIRINNYDKASGNEHFVLGIESVLEFAEYLPAVDAVEVVRCWECKKIQTSECLLCSFDIDGYCTGGPPSDFYCADGERRESEDTTWLEDT